MRPYYQLVSYRILRRCFKTIKVRLPARRIAVPSRDPNCLSSLFWEFSWKTQVIGAALALRPGTFLDVGANVGQSLFDYLATGANSAYFGFEPNIRCATYLSALIRRNALDRATLVPVALGDAASLLELHTPSESETDSAAFIHAFVRPHWRTRREYIPCLRFDDIAGLLGIGQIALCKIDVEGFELEVLRGMSTTLAALKPPILCEVLDADADADMAVHGDRIARLQAALADLDYRIFHLRKTADGRCAGLEPIAEIPKRKWAKEAEEQCDYLFAHRSDAFPGELIRQFGGG
jgi:FkbM family methyltransferase